MIPQVGLWYATATLQAAGSTTPLVVQLGLAPKWMDLDSNGVLTATLWLRLVWTDHRLAWDPEDHDGISVLRFFRSWL